MKVVDYKTMSRQALDQLQKGAFLTTAREDEVNTMTIAWGNIGYMWNKPIFTVMVRPSRHTYSLIEESDSFTVSFPINEDLKKALAYCGSQSGRDTNKIKDAGLTIQDGVEVSTPVIKECSLHYECKIVGRQVLEPDHVNDTIQNKAYGNGDYHVLYYGEIVTTYVTE